MKVIVFGASGTVGKHLVNQALSDGHEVSAFCRNPKKLAGLSHPNLALIQGDVLNSSDVAEAVKNHDLVCITLGSGKDRKSEVRSRGTKVIIEAMQSSGVKRLICQTTLGAGDSHIYLNFFWRNIMFGWYLKKIFQDHELQEQYVIQSGLNWTIVRPSAFMDGERTGQYHHGSKLNGQKLRLKISRADVADFILQQFQSDQYLGETPGLSN